MIFDAARLAFSNLFAPETRSVFWKVIGLTLLVLVAAWFALKEILAYLALPWLSGLLPVSTEWAGWFTFIIGIFASLGLALALALLMAPVTALIAGFFSMTSPRWSRSATIRWSRPVRRCPWAKRSWER